jgi:hypothetical protein
MVLVGRYVVALLAGVSGFKVTLHELGRTRTYPKINVYLSEGFASLVNSKYYQSILKRRLVPPQTGMTVNRTRSSYQCP